MIQTAEISTATEAEETQVIATIVTAFSADPAARWMYPDAKQYLEYFPAFVRAFGGKAFAHSSAHFADVYAGAALWLPPDVHPDDEELMALLERSVSTQVLGDMLSVFERMAACHPDRPHWYLPLIGVDLPFQGLGYGSALLRHALAMCDRQHLPAYLESTNPRNTLLYERHGFERAGVIQAGTSPPIIPMVRPAQ